MNHVFTQHALEQIKRRKIMKQEVLDTISFPDIITKRDNKMLYRKKLGRGTIEVCCERENILKIITVYWV